MIFGYNNMDNMIIFYLAKATMDSATPDNFIELCNQNEGFISLILATLSLIISAIAIYQSVLVAKRQEKLQRRQAQIDSYTYLYECYESLSNIYSEVFKLDYFIESYYNKNYTTQIKELIYTQISEIENSNDQYSIKLRFSRTLFPDQIYKSIEDVINLYEKLCVCLYENNVYIYCDQQEIKCYDDKNTQEQIENAFIEISKYSKNLLQKLEYLKNKIIIYMKENPSYHT